MKPELRVLTLVLVGRFASKPVSIKSLVDSKAIGQGDANSAEYELLIPDHALAISFPWGRLQIEPERLVVETAQVPYVRALDLASKIVAELAPTSVCVKFGINVTSHYRFMSMTERDVFACKMAPPASWGEFGAKVEASFKETGDKHGGLMRLTMRQAIPEDRAAGWLDITIEPSAAIKDNAGVAVMTNDHYELSTEEAKDLKGSARAISEQLLETLNQCFDLSIERSIAVSDGVVA